MPEVEIEPVEPLAEIDVEPVPKKGLWQRFKESVNEEADDLYNAVRGTGKYAPATHAFEKNAAAAVEAGANLVSQVPAQLIGGMSMYVPTEQDIKERFGMAPKTTVLEKLNKRVERFHRIVKEFTAPTDDPDSAKIAETVMKPLTLIAETGEDSAQFYDKKAQEAKDRGDNARAEAWEFIAFVSRTGGETAPFFIPGLVKPLKVVSKKVGELVKGKEKPVKETLTPKAGAEEPPPVEQNTATAVDVFPEVEESIGLEGMAAQVQGGAINKKVYKPETEINLTPESLEAQVKGGPLKDLDVYAEKSSINLDKLNTTEDVKQFLNGLTRTIEKKIGKRTVTWEETRNTAEALGWNIRDAKNAWSRKKSFTAAEIEASRQLNLNAVSSLHEKLFNLPADRTSWTPELRAQVLDAMDMIRVTSQASSEAGRALNIHKKALSEDTSFGVEARMSKVLKTLKGKGVGRADEVIEMLRGVDFNDVPSINKLIYNLTKTRWQKLTDGAYELWINGLLSNPGTHGVNTTSNALTLAYTYPEDILAAGVEAARAGITRTPREMYFGEVGHDIFTLAKGLQDGVKRTVNVQLHGDISTKFDYAPSAFPEKVQPFTPARGLMAEDAFFKGLIESQTMSRIALRTAMHEGLRGKAAKARVQELLDTPTEFMLEQAAARGKYLTFQKELGEAGRLVMRARDVVPGLKYFIPFIKTPANIMKFALERSPMNGPVVAYKAFKGELTGAELSSDVAKVTMGTALTALTYLLAKQGFVTGGGPPRAMERQEKMSTGWLPYSFKINGTYYSFARMEPLGTILGLAADYANIEKSMTEDEKYNIAAGIAGAITTNITDKTFMTGFSNMLDFIGDPGAKGERIFNNLAGTVVPAVSAGAARAVDPTIRDTRNALDVIKSRIVGLSSDLPPKLTVWGDPIQRPGTAATRFISPMQVSEEKGSPIEKELVKLKLNIGYPSRKMSGEELTQDEYWELVKRSGEPAKRTLNTIITRSPDWDSYSDEIKSKIIQTTVSDFREAEQARLRAKLIREGRIKP